MCAWVYYVTSLRVVHGPVVRVAAVNASSFRASLLGCHYAKLHGSNQAVTQSNWLLWTFVSIYVLQCLTDLWLERINLAHLEKHGNRLPDSLHSFVDADMISRIRAYTAAKNRLAIFESLAANAVLLVYILSGLMTRVAWALETAGLPFALAGWLFFLVPAVVLHAATLPFDYYFTFVIEERFGFNRSTRKLWLIDQAKAVLLSGFVFSVLLLSVLGLIHFFPAAWWLWTFLVVSLVQILLTVLYPKLIAPLFNKFEPVKDESLAASIRALMEANGLRVRHLFQMDAGLRSRHTNAYFTGLGRTKQVVLFDTLIEAHPPEEILAVLAHELGHFREKHIVKQLFLFEAALLIGLALTFQLLTWPPLHAAFGFAGMQPYAGLFVIGIFWRKAGYFLQPAAMALSRHFEREADRFAARAMGSPLPLAAALKRTAADNLSNLSPHPLYVRFHYSHPPLLERLERLERSAGSPPNTPPLVGGAGGEG